MPAPDASEREIAAIAAEHGLTDRDVSILRGAIGSASNPDDELLRQSLTSAEAKARAEELLAEFDALPKRPRRRR